MIRLVGPGGAGKTTIGALLARRLGVMFVDLDERFTATHGDISRVIDVQGYARYATENVQAYLDLASSPRDLIVLALSSGFMTYPNDVHPLYAQLRQEIASSPLTLVLLPSCDFETCVTETVRRQLGRPFARSAEREEQVIRSRFEAYRSLPATKVETMGPLSEAIDAALANLPTSGVPALG